MILHEMRSRAEPGPDPSEVSPTRAAPLVLCSAAAMLALQRSASNQTVANALAGRLLSLIVFYLEITSQPALVTAIAP